MPLTDIELKRAKPGEKPYKLSDAGGALPLVTPSSGKLWRWSYRYECKHKLMTFGRYPDVSLAEAREMRLAERRVLAAGSDPMAVRKAGKQAEAIAAEKAFSNMAKLWLEHWREGKSTRNVETMERRIAQNVLPVLGAKPIDRIEAPDVVAMVRLIDGRGARDIAKRALETTGQIFRYAVAHRHATRNPAAEIRPRDILRPSRRTNYARIDAKELPELLRRLEIYPGTHLTRLAIKLMALTFVRTGELIGARWPEFDIAAARWAVPEERMKMRTPHIVPLSKQALDVLSALRDLSNGTARCFWGNAVPHST